MRTTAYPGAEKYLPPRHSLTALRAAVQECRGCPLYQNATQAVFGEGPRRARMVMVGEQPGNDEDLAGHPFVGPAGRLLNEVLDEIGLSRTEVFITNAVKHFKWKFVQKRRKHEKPDAAEVAACRPWLEAELAAVKPTVLVVLGATAAQTLLGRSFRVTQQRGVDIESTFAKHTVATIHPSAILRQRTSVDRARERAAFARDLGVARDLT